MSLEKNAASQGAAAQPLVLCEAPNTASHLRLQNVSVAYQSPVIEGVSFDVPQNQVTALLGPSGCGKSSLLMAINHLAQEQGAQVSGEILHSGDSILKPSLNLMQLRRHIGYIFQRPNPFPLSIYKNLDMPLREHGVGRAARGAKIEKTLKDVGLWDQVRNRLHQSALDLSGGQQQRLCIARALVLEPEILLMDEPCSALDPMAGALIEDLILKLQKDITIVIVTHNIAQAKRVAQQVAFFWMNTAGFLVEHQTAERFFSEPKSELARRYTQSM